MFKFVSSKYRTAYIASLVGAALILQFGYVSAAGFTKIFEAEENSVGNQVVEATNQPDFTGKSFMDYAGADSSLTWNKVEIPAAGNYTLVFSYGNGGADGAARPCTIEVNGKKLTPQIEFKNNGAENWSWKTDSITADLKSGVNTIKLTSIGNGPNIDSLTVTNEAAGATDPAPAAEPATKTTPTAGSFTKIFEAEENTVGNQVVPATNKPDYTGKSFMDYAGAGSSLTWNKVEVPAAGNYTLVFSYGNGGADGADRPCTLEINGQKLTAQVVFKNNGIENWTWKMDNIAADLKAGVNTVKLISVGNGPNIDSLTVTNDPASIAAGNTKPTTPVTPAAVEKTSYMMILKLNSNVMTINGAAKEIDPGKTTAPVVDDASSRTLVPIRAIVEEMGGTIDFDGADKSGRADITLGQTSVKVWIDDNNAQVDGRDVTLDVTPKVINDRTMLPLRFVTENLGAKVEWSPITQEIVIRYTK